MATLILTCKCGQKMKVSKSALGKTGTCVGCGRRLKITRKNARIQDGEIQTRVEESALEKRLAEGQEVSQGEKAKPAVQRDRSAAIGNYSLTNVQIPSAAQPLPPRFIARLVPEWEEPEGIGCAGFLLWLVLFVLAHIEVVRRWLPRWYTEGFWRSACTTGLTATAFVLVGYMVARICHAMRPLREVVKQRRKEECDGLWPDSLPETAEPISLGYLLLIVGSWICIFLFLSIIALFPLSWFYKQGLEWLNKGTALEQSRKFLIWSGRFAAVGAAGGIIHTAFALTIASVGGASARAARRRRISQISACIPRYVAEPCRLRDFATQRSLQYGVAYRGTKLGWRELCDELCASGPLTKEDCFGALKTQWEDKGHPLRKAWEQAARLWSQYDARRTSCPNCKGVPRWSVVCPECKGHGKLERVTYEGDDAPITLGSPVETYYPVGRERIDCGTCSGSGRLERSCSNCSGKGEVRVFSEAQMSWYEGRLQEWLKAGFDEDGNRRDALTSPPLME